MTETMKKEDKDLYELMICEKSSGFTDKEDPGVPKERILDDFYEKIGFRRYQLVSIFLIGFLNMGIGAESLFLNIIQLQLIEEWGLEIYEAALLVSTFSMGIALGGYISGYISDNFGRRGCLLYTTFFSFFFAFLSTFVNNFPFFTCLNFLLSVLIGIAAITSNSYLIEWLPIKNRSLIMSYTQLYPLGMIGINYLGYLCIDNNDKMVNWRGMGRLVSFVFFFCSLIIFFCCYETPKFFLSKRKFDECFYILDKIGCKMQLTEVEKKGIIDYSSDEEAFKVQTSCKELFRGLFLRITFVLISFRLISSTLNYGALFILPIILGNKDKTTGNLNQKEAMLDFLYTNLVALPAPFLRGVLTELKFLGRKYTVFLCCVLGLMGFLTTLFFKDYLTISVGFARLCMTISSGTLVIYNTEVFPTKVRTLAVGFVSAVTRIGSVISPYVFYFLYGIDIQYVFYCFVVLISLNGVLTLFLPMDTRGMALDNMEELRRRKEEEDLFGRRRG